VWRAEVLDLVARQLRPVDFLLLQWIYFHGMSRQQIAAKLQIPVDTANKRIERAVARAREILVSANDDS
jgi:DNA-directed RNA polymerase specialized sigma24 family protein